MAVQDNGIFNEETNPISVREKFSKYIENWPLFVVCLLLCLCAGYFYTRYTVPKYLASTYFLVKGSQNVGPNSSDLIEEALNGKRQVNINNEMLLIGSSELMERTIIKNNYNISYFKKGRLLNTDIYKDAPFTLVAIRPTDKSQSIFLDVHNINTLGGHFLLAEDKTKKFSTFYWGIPFSLRGQTFVLQAKRKIQSEIGEYIVRWQSVKDCAFELTKNFTIKVYDPKTSVIQLTLKTENLQRGKEILNALFDEFNLSDIEDRNKLSESTVQFIDDRLIRISAELKGVEGNLENYQGNNQLIDIKSQSSQSLENLNDVSKTIKNLGIQRSVTEMILEYFANPENSRKLVPSSLGLNDATLASLITQYNELQLKKEREAPLVAPNSTVMQDLNSQIGNLKGSILESLNNISKNLRLQENSFNEQNSRYRNLLSSMPHNERVLQEIKRKQGITEGLYLYLLQKREETAISGTSSNIAHYKQIDPATGLGPVEPNTRNIILCSALLGLLIAFGVIYFKDLLNDKIIAKDDIRKKMSFPMLGDIGHIQKKNKKVISVMGRNFAGEQFRVIRTNLSFLLKNKHEKVILITSYSSGEGKSFISLNLAAVFAIPGKKVALLEFDIRKPVIGNNLSIDKAKGLTDFLSGQVNNISEITHFVEEIPTLNVFVSGQATLNSTDLLLTENMNRLFEALKEKYDYIIIDTPPAGLVSDALILGEFSDIILFIIRQNITLKKELNAINEIINKRHLKNVGMILNDVKTGAKDAYSYGYDYKD